MKHHTLALFVLLLCSVSGYAATIHVPSEQPSIGQGIEAASSGDTVLVAPGFYSGSRNRGIFFWGKEIALIGEGGPTQTTIDCDYRDRAFYLGHGESPATIIDGFTISRGGGRTAGGGIGLYRASPTIRNCIFLGCHVEYSGGHSGSSTLGGAIACDGGHPTIANCTFAGNSLGPAEIMYGTAIDALASDVTIENCLFFQNSTAGPEIHVALGGSVQHCISDQDNDYPEGNMWGVSPAMCGVPVSVFYPCSDSPALPEYNEWGELVGALPSGCGPCNSEVRESTWGSVKALFR